MCETGCSRQQVSRSVCVWKTAGHGSRGCGGEKKSGREEDRIEGIGGDSDRGGSNINTREVERMLLSRVLIHTERELTDCRVCGSSVSGCTVKTSVWSWNFLCRYISIWRASFPSSRPGSLRDMTTDVMNRCQRNYKDTEGQGPPIHFN